MRSRTMMFSLALASVLALAACASGSDEPGGSSTPGSAAATAAGTFQEKAPLAIGYSVYDLQNPYWQRYQKGVQAEADTVGAKLVVADQKSSQQEQVSGSLDLINQGISALIITPVQPSALPETIDAAHAAKIPVVIGDIGTAGDYDAYILSNNENGGELAAKYVVDKLGQKPGTHKIGVIGLHAGSVVGEQRVKGFLDAIGKESNFQVVSQLAGNDTVDGGFKAAQDMLSANPDLEVIYAANDDSAVGAQRALQTAGISVGDDFTLIGFDGNDTALGLIDQGQMSATVAQDPYGQGKKAVDVALALVRGQDAGYTDASSKTVYFPVELVTKDNLADYRQAHAGQ